MHALKKNFHCSATVRHLWCTISWLRPSSQNSEENVLLISVRYRLTPQQHGDIEHSARQLQRQNMMTSSNGNNFRVTGHLCREFNGHRWIPCTKASDAELWCFFDLHLNKRLSKQWSGWWFETSSCPLWRHGNDMASNHDRATPKVHWEYFGEKWRLIMGLHSIVKTLHQNVHYSDVIMSAMASQITCVSIAYSTFCSGADQRKHQSSALLAFVRGIQRWWVDSPHQSPVTRKIFPFNDVIMVEFINKRSQCNEAYSAVMGLVPTWITLWKWYQVI